MQHLRLRILECDTHLSLNNNIKTINKIKILHIKTMWNYLNLFITHSGTGEKKRRSQMAFLWLNKEKINAVVLEVSKNYPNAPSENVSKNFTDVNISLL